MKKTILIFSFFLIAFSNAFAQGKAMDKWQSLLNKPQLAEYFSGIFNSMGFIVEESGEQFTVNHLGDHFTIHQGVNKNEVDYVVYLKQENIDNMQKHGSDEKIDEYESFRIMSVLFTPLTEASLTNPMLTKPVMRKMSGIENHIHVNLISPDKQDTVSHTLIYLNKEWMVIAGTHGKAERVFNLTPEEAVKYQRKVFTALQTDTMKGWKQFKKWYMDWRSGVSKEIIC